MARTQATVRSLECSRSICLLQPPGWYRRSEDSSGRRDAQHSRSSRKWLLSALCEGIRLAQEGNECGQRPLSRRGAVRADGDESGGYRRLYGDGPGTPPGRLNGRSMQKRQAPKVSLQCWELLSWIPTNGVY